MSLEIGQTAPEFALLDQHETRRRLSDYRGKWVILYFYPEDRTSGCTTEACQMRDNLEDFEAADAVVLGVSTDSVDSHERFADAEGLHFPLLSDEEKLVTKQYGVLNTEGDRALRSTFIINPEGKIREIYEQVEPSGHADNVLHDLERLKNEEQ
jgi:peroxiredoxin Q/BCP